MSSTNLSKVDQIKNSRTYIGKRGYTLNKKYFKNEELNSIRADLNVKPNVCSDYGAQEEPFKVYLETENNLHIPKFYGIEKYGNAEYNVLPKGKNIDINFSLSLKEEQKIPANETLKAYREKGGGILSLPCGFGKTILALYFISQLKKKTIVIVHKEFLMNQWVERIKFALPDAKVGIVQGDKCQIAGYDIIIGMLQTLSMKEFEQNAFNEIGHVIIDECHRIPSRVFSKALLKINSNYMLGLSATPNRKDGLTKVLKWYIGDIIYSVKSSEKNIVKVDRYLLDSTDPNYNQEILSFRGTAQMPTMLNNIANCQARTNLIMEKVIAEVNANESRQFLILSDRKQHLEDMFKYAQNAGIESVGYYVGGMKKEKLKENESCKILLGTYPMANEGLDIPSLNGLVLSTPKSDIIQSVGRICRVKHENIQPLIIDIVDRFSIFGSQGRKRLDVYRKKKYQVTDISYNLDKKIVTFQKNYFYHNCTTKNEKDSSDEDSDNPNDEDIEIDTDYNNIDSKSNKPIKGKRNNVTKKDSTKKDIDNLFKSFSMFS